MDMVQRGAVKLQHMEIDEHIFNVLNKHVARVKFDYLIQILGVIQNDTPQKRE